MNLLTPDICATASLFKILRFQALIVLGGTEEDYCSLERQSYGSDWSGQGQGRPWNKRPKHQQLDGLHYVLNRLFNWRVLGQPWGSACPHARRQLLLDMCREAVPRLVEEGWSRTDALEWVLDVEARTKL